MGISDAPDIFQTKMSILMQSLEYVHMNLDNLLIISVDMFVEHINKVDEVLDRLSKANLCVNG